MTSRDPGNDDSHEDIYVAVRDAFTATKRQLEDYVRKTLHRGDVPREGNGAAHGRISFIDIEQEWGWIDPDDGRQIYFHRNSVVDGMSNLQVDDEVRFSEEMGDQGPQASSVSRIGANGRHEMATHGRSARAAGHG